MGQRTKNVLPIIKVFQRFNKIQENINIMINLYSPLIPNNNQHYGKLMFLIKLTPFLFPNVAHIFIILSLCTQNIVFLKKYFDYVNEECIFCQ